jgi:hypothetical protein
MTAGDGQRDEELTGVSLQFVQRAFAAAAAR